MLGVEKRALSNAVGNVQKRKDVGLKAEQELSQAERQQRRAAKKRVRKRKEAEVEEASGVAAHPKGIKSAREDAAAEKQAKAVRKRAKSAAGKAGATSSTVFRKLQDEREAGGRKQGSGAEAQAQKASKSAHLMM